ncbi:MAG: ABC transporter substrate-binding protein [Deltaproteobacteria bacterium]|nr:ABC transporter substrate-binding protein [Deltaproteobacteria bacterium]
MKKSFGVLAVLLVLASLIGSKYSLAASPSLLKAKKEAEAKGYLFETSHDAIVDKAKKQGRLRVTVNLEPKTLVHLAKVFREKYPFVDAYVEESTGVDTSERFFLELQAGRANWDIARINLDTNPGHLKHAKKVDLLEMAGHGVLKIPIKMIDPRNRNVLATSSHAGVAAFNRCVLEPSRVPNRWEDFLKPEFKGRKFAAEIRPLNHAPMAAGAGEEWLVSYAKRIAAQQPIWFRGHTRALMAMTAGEIALHSLTNYNSVMTVIQKDPQGCLQVKPIDPIPVRLSVFQMVLENATNPHAGILWLEFMASPAAQRILDDELFKSSIYAHGSALEELVRGKKVWVLDWDHFEKSERWVQMAVEAFGFPTAERN